ncbi:MAG: adenine-specific methyltransferase EcoRI family protein [Clostridiales bacterium]|nr:adenine-specific methyltransferase EcoRI family protein [Clostridiales bacterium]
MANKKLASAKDAKKDEFYTQYEDIQREVNAYLEYNPDTFRDKIVLLPCDDPEWSNFTRFFAQNFEALVLIKLISSSIAADAKKTKYGYEERVDWQQMTIFEIM